MGGKQPQITDTTNTEALLYNILQVYNIHVTVYTA